MIKTFVARGWNSGINTFFILMRVMIPVYILITVVRHTPLLGWLSEIFQPAMAFFGLPGEAVMVLILGQGINIYAAVGAISGLELGVREITILGGMLTISHSLPLETMVIRQARVPVKGLLFIRVGLSLLSGVILNLLL